MDVGRLRRGDRIAGAGSAVVFLAMFLPWYGTATLGFTVDGLWHGWMVISLLLAVATIVYLAAQTVTDLRLRVANWRLLAGATGSMCALSVIGLLAKPPGATLEWGAFVALVAAAAAFGGALVRRSEPDPAERPAVRRG